MPESGIFSLQSKGDADVVIIKKCFGDATKSDVDVTTEDTGILVLLIYQWNGEYEDFHDKYFNTGLKVKEGKVSSF